MESKSLSKKISKTIINLEQNCQHTNKNEYFNIDVW